MILPKKVSIGDTVGIVSPCDVKNYEKLIKPEELLRSMGFKVKYGENTFKDTWGYAASAKERADDFNAMASDDEVSLVFFGGGDVGCEVLPLLDYEAIKRSRKAYCSYSDSTSILNAITSLTGLVTFHGQTPRTFEDLNDYNVERFKSVIIERDGIHKRASDWTVLHGGACRGRLIGGYTQNVCLMLSSPYFSYTDEKYILFLEDYFWFSEPAIVARYVEHIIQSEFFKNVCGVIFGGYGEGDDVVTQFLRRKAESIGIPFVKCNDFGHGTNNAIFPIGAMAELDCEKASLRFEI